MSMTAGAGNKEQKQGFFEYLQALDVVRGGLLSFEERSSRGQRHQTFLTSRPKAHLFKKIDSLAEDGIEWPRPIGEKSG